MHGGLGNNSPHFQNIGVSCNLDREEICELGRKTSYHKYVNFPVKTESEIGSWDVVGRAMKIIEEGFKKKMDDDAWGTIRNAGI